MDKADSLDFNYAYQYCKNIAIKHYENFPVGSLLIPKSKRKYIYSIYAFARFADDIADSDRYTEIEKLCKLNELDEELNKIDLKIVSDFVHETKNIFLALYDTIAKLNIPIMEFRDLLTAFKQDSIKSRYDNFYELINYSNYSANPVGHLVLNVFGYVRDGNEKLFEYSDKVCTALQLTNFWQDVSNDLKLDRVYIPKSLMDENRYSYNMLFAKTENEEFVNIIKILVDKTRQLFFEGKEILKLTSGRLRMELSAIISGGEEILNKIIKVEYKVLSENIRISNSDKFRILLKVVLK